MKRIQYYFLFLLMLLSLFASAQEISNIHFEQVGKQVHIYYDLQGDQTYNWVKIGLQRCMKENLNLNN